MQGNASFFILHKVGNIGIKSFSWGKKDNNFQQK